MAGDKRVTGLGGVFFKANNPSFLSKWYADNLGLPVEDSLEPHSAVSAVFAWRDEADPDRRGSTVWAIFPRDTTYLGDGPVMLNYRVDNLDAVLAALQSQGVWIDPRREDHEYGRFAWIKDPEGNRIELWQPIEPDPN